MSTLMDRIIQYRYQNELPTIENLGMVLETYWCSQKHNQGLCNDMPLQRGWVATLKGGVALIKQIAFKRFCSQQEADRRAAICAGCPKNVFPDKTFFTQWSDEMAENMVGIRKSSEHDKLGNCEVCTCVLKAKVFADPRDIEHSKEELEQMPDFCWVKNK